MDIRITSLSSFAGTIVVSAALVACGSKLPEGSEKMDLSSSGLTVSIEAPKGGQARADGPRTTIEWGPHGEAGSLTLAKREAELRCTGLDEDCKIVEQGDKSIIKELTFMKKRKVRGVANVSTGGAMLGCDVTGGDIESVRRLVAACKSVTAMAPIATTTTVTSGSAIAAKPTAPPVLQEISVKTSDMKGPLAYTISVPEGATTLESGASRTFGSPKGTPPQSGLSISVTPYSVVSSLAAAEKESKALDIGGLDPIAERKELSKTTFMLASAPRGTGRMMTVSVFASGKKRGVLARCSGSEAMRASLEAICSSLKVE